MMNKRFKILSIGDIHGRDIWQIALFGTKENYEYWRSNPSCDLSSFPISQYDKIVFIGDYVDSFDISPVEIKMNLENIIHLKLIFPDVIVLLWGNHDISYYRNTRCTGFQPAMMWDYTQLFSTKIGEQSIFQAAYQYNNWLWAHAGVTMGFYNNVLSALSNPKKNRFSFLYENTSISEKLNLMEQTSDPNINLVGYSRGGYSKVPGPYWADKGDLYNKPIFGLNQVVGHTHQDVIKGYTLGGGRYQKSPVTLYFIDNLGSDTLNQVLSMEFIDGEETPIVDILNLT